MTPRAVPRYRLFEVVGLELEYPVVDRDLRPCSAVAEAFRQIDGRPTSDIERDGVGFSNELADHVFELKTLEPERSLVRAEAKLVAGLRSFARILRERFDLRLLPTGMHPFMRPADAKLWQRSGRAIYETYAKIFTIRDHGWLNVQASHVNLPFASEADTVLLHNAIACLLPYLPALAASSPIYEGTVGDALDSRLIFYKLNQRRIPQITADVVPEPITSFADYRRRILKPIYDRLQKIKGGERLCHEWVNSRGAIMRFSRRAIEIRVLDMQECIRADVAVAAFIRGALSHLVRQLRSGTLAFPDHAMLVADFDSAIRHGSRAPVQALHLRPRSLRRQGDATTARFVLGELLEAAYPELSAEEQPYLSVIEDRISRGSLAERILHQVQRRSDRRGGARATAAIREVYEELARCLENNTTWDG
jgi:carboxylate-amine ligase